MSRPHRPPTRSGPHGPDGRTSAGDAVSRAGAMALRTLVAALALCGAGCMAGGAPPAPAGGTGAEGSLRQDEITVELQIDDLRIRLTPLDPGILQVTAPDTRRRLSSLVPPGAEGVHFLVAIYTEAPGGAAFEPRSVSLENRGRLFRPVGIRGVTPGWGRARLAQQEAQQAVYTFSQEVELELPLTVVVGSVRNGEWASILPRIDAERARIGASGAS